jgi:glyoxylase-like metal-dependent hydrolase (beta-lactamase superfamily II)
LWPPSEANIENGLPIAQTLDPASNIAAQRRMVELAGDPNRVIPGHDPAVFTRFKLVAPNVARLVR